MTVSSMGVLPVEVRALATGREVAISGHIDVHTVADVRLLLHEIIDTGTGDVLMRLGAAEIGDATGLGVLVEAYNQAAGPAAVYRRRHVGARERLLRASQLDRSLVQRGGSDARPLWRLSPPEPLPDLRGPRVPSAPWPTPRMSPPASGRPAGMARPWVMRTYAGHSSAAASNEALPAQPRQGTNQGSRYVRLHPDRLRPRPPPRPR